MLRRIKRYVIRKYEPFCYYNHETGSYLKLLIMPYFWKRGIDPYHNPDSLFISFGPVHIATAHNSDWSRTSP